MSYIYKTLKSSNINSLPYVAKKTSTIITCDGNDSIRAYKAKVTSRDEIQTGSLSNESILYFAVENLFYKGYISQSNQSGSFTDLKLQTIGSQESLQKDIRQYNYSSDVKVVSISQNLFGEKVSPKTFKVISSVGDYYIIDDGQGNLIDINNFQPSSLTDSDIYSGDFIYNYYQQSSSIGNIIYNQGILIITNYDYYCVFDAGAAIVQDYNEIFLTTDSTKQIYTIFNAETDCAAIDYSTFTTIPISGSQFPNITVDENGVITLDESDILSNTPGIYEIFYYVLTEACAPSNIAKLTVQILECIVEGSTILEAPSAPTPTPTPTRTLTPSPTPSITPSISLTPTNTPTQTVGVPITPSITPTITNTPTKTPLPTRTQTRTPIATPTQTRTMTPSRVPSNSSTFRLGASQELACFGPLTTLYWQGQLGVGTVLYTDSSLLNPLSGYAAISLDTNASGGVDGNVNGSVFVLNNGNTILWKSAYYCNSYVFQAVVADCIECTSGPFESINVISYNWYPSAPGYYTDENLQKSIYISDITSGSASAPEIFSYVLSSNYGPYESCFNLQQGIGCDFINP